jgi:hypothetical protein
VPKCPVCASGRYLQPPGFCKILVTFDDGRAPEVLSTDSGGKFDVKKFRQSACSFQPMTMTQPPLPLGGKFRLQLPLVKEETHEVDAVVAKQQFKYKDQPIAECEATGIFTHADGRITTISARTDAQGYVPLLLPQGCISQYQTLTTVIADDGKTKRQIVVPAHAFDVPARAQSAARDAVISRTVAKDSSRIEFLSFCKGTHIIFLADTSDSMEGAKLEVLKRTIRKALDEVPNCRQSIALQAWNTTAEWFRSKLPAQQPLSARFFSKRVPNELCDTILGGAGDFFQDPVIAADGNTCAILIYLRCKFTAFITRALANTLTTNAGHRYERSRIESWLFANSTSPMDKSPLQNKQLIPNRDMYSPASTTSFLNASINHHDNPSTFPQQAEARFHLS